MADRLAYLIPAERLSAILGRPDVRIVDCSWYLDDPAGGLRDHVEGHIPGAVYANLDTDLSGNEGAGRHPLPTPADFGRTLGRLGISPETSVVVYDQRGGAIASRLWWMLTAQGHASVAVLDGGLQAWEDAGLPLESGTSEVEPAYYRCSAWTGIVDRDQVANRTKEQAVVDARAAERYRGDEEPIDPVAGHIPGAINFPLEGNLDEGLRFLPPGVLEDRFVAAGLTDGTKVISQCGSGVTACHTILAMELAGLGRPSLYVGSWSDWSTSGMPIGEGDRP